MKRVFIFCCVIIMLALCIVVHAEGNTLGTATITSNGIVNVRKEPGKNAKIVGKAKPGLTYEYLSIAENGWVEIVLEDGKTGFVSGKICKVSESKTSGDSQTHEPKENGPIEIEVTLDKEELLPGEIITATYRITGGSGKYTHIQLEWAEQIAGSNGWSILKSDNSKRNKKMLPNGEFSFQPQNGGKIRFMIMVEDTDRRFQDYLSQEIEVRENKTVEPIATEITTSKTTVKSGEPVTAEYEITGGSGEYAMLQIEWRIKAPNSSGWSILKTENNWNGLKPESKGISVITPKTTGTLQFTIMLEDTEGRSFYMESENIAVK